MSFQLPILLNKNSETLVSVVCNQVRTITLHHDYHVTPTTEEYVTMMTDSFFSSIKEREDDLNEKNDDNKDEDEDDNEKIDITTRTMKHFIVD